MSPALTLILVVLAVGLLAWLLRAASRGDETPTLPDAAAPPEPAVADDEEPDEGVELAVTTDGEVLIPYGRTLRIVALGDPEDLSRMRDEVEAGLVTLDPHARATLARGASGVTLQPGDFTAARVRRSGAEDAPWRVETLGRDGEYGFLPFETEDGARAALALVEQGGIVRRPVDEDGSVIPPGADDFREARRRYEETQRELALGLDPDERGPAPDWSSRR